MATGGEPYSAGSGCCGCNDDCGCLAGESAEWCGTPDFPGAGGFSDPPAQWWLAPKGSGVFGGTTANVRHVTGTDEFGTVWNGFEARVYYLAFSRTSGCAIGYVYQVAYILVNCNDGGLSGCEDVMASWQTAVCEAGCIVTQFPDTSPSSGMSPVSFVGTYTGTATVPIAICEGETFQFFLPASGGLMYTGPADLVGSTGPCNGIPQIGSVPVPMTVDEMVPYTFGPDACACVGPEDGLANLGGGGGGEGLMASVFRVSSAASPAPRCEFLPGDPAAAGEAAADGLNPARKWYRCGNPDTGVGRLSLLVSECNSCGVPVGRRCGPVCPGYVAAADEA